jgi:succinate dehydrogenase / fumarate reductase flavoprotein subunit
LADGYFVLPNTIGDYLASNKLEPVSADAPEVKAAVADVASRTSRLLAV